MNILVVPERTAQGGRVSLRASPEHDPNADWQFVWDTGEIDPQRVTKARITHDDDLVTIDTTGLAPGAYLVRGTASSTFSDETGVQTLVETRGEAFVIIDPSPITEPVSVNLTPRLADGTDANLALWQAIRNRTEAIAFQPYREFIDRVMCADDGDDDDPDDSLDDPKERKQRKRLKRHRRLIVSEFHGVDAYNLLRTATDAFLILEAGVFVRPPVQNSDTGERFPIDSYVPGEAGRAGRSFTFDQIQDALTVYLGQRGLPYLDRIVSALGVSSDSAYPDCVYVPNGDLRNRLIFDRGLRHPLLLELIWSYWLEEGMLVQTINAISLRFQNRRSPAGRDPLENLELDPLRPLNNLLWGYIQDEYRRLTVQRRAYEYVHEYGLPLYGKAVPDMRAADKRSKFIEAFHNLLYMAAVFYKQADDTTVNADPFPLLNALREVHLILAQGAHNQFGDLPWTARGEMLVQQWLLARPEAQDFLRGRIMVPFEEAWMGPVETMKSLQGWTDTSISHFHRLARFGEQLVLSIRYTNWIDINDPETTRSWALYWRPEIQTYIHSYRAATGVDLAADVTANQPADLRYQRPSDLLRQRLEARRNGRNGKVPVLPQTAPAPAGFRERKAQRK